MEPMEQSKKIANRDSVIYALIHAITYVVATFVLSEHLIDRPLSIIIAIVPIITFVIFIIKYIKAFSEMDEVKQRVQLEAVVIGFSLTVMLIMLLFLLGLCDVSYPDFFSFANMVAMCWGFYFIGWIVTKKKYGV
jgi:hypothetical protein